MTNNIEIRRFKIEDTKEVYSLIQNSLSTESIVKIYDKELLDFWTSFYSKECIIGLSKIKHLYVAVYKGNIAACGAINEEDGKGYISTVYTDPNIQGKGLGKLIMNTLEHDEIAQKTKKIFLHSSLSANTFYQKLGYHYYNDTPEVILDCGLDMIHLEKEL